MEKVYQEKGAAMEYSSLETNYRQINRFLNEALLKWHPDVNKDERALSVTLFLLHVKAQARRIYMQLKKGGNHVL